MEKNLWEVYTEDQLKELESLTGDYKKFLDTGKTERECVTEVIRPVSYTHLVCCKGGQLY